MEIYKRHRGIGVYSGFDSVFGRDFEVDSTELEDSPAHFIDIFFPLVYDLVAGERSGIRLAGKEPRKPGERKQISDERKMHCRYRLSVV